MVCFRTQTQRATSRIVIKRDITTNDRAVKHLLRSVIGIAFVLLLPSSAKPQIAPTSVHVWIKSFIPNDHPTIEHYFKKTTAGTWVVEAPSSGPINVAGLNGSCFETDNRLFSIDPLVSARVTVEFVLKITDREMHVEKAEGREQIRVDATKNVDCKSGALLQPVKFSDKKYVNISDVKSMNTLRTVGVQISSPNPFYPEVAGHSIAPRIDFQIVFEYDNLERKVRIKGVTGAFPSFEAYYAHDDGPVETIVQFAPEKSAWSLVDFGTGVNTRNFKAEIDLW